ncbi:ABC transporter permease [Candidatus Poriferisodalis sp.]|uniref:ABC transporter permease n=1 Tax=Candidatus Poriferisodalis sp. TaxID=3101277 RepID=UPI003B02D50D
MTVSRLTQYFSRYGILVAYGLLVLAVAAQSDRFLTKRNWLNLLDQAAPLGLIAVGVTLCIVAGIFDLSTGSVFAVAAVVAAKVAELNPWIGLTAGVAAGALLGAFNALVMRTTGVNSFIGTLATSIIFRGIALLTTGGLIVSVADRGYKTLGTETFLDAKLTVWVFAAVAVILGLTLARTTLGRSLYAIGGNPEAARLVGIRVGSVQTFAYVMSGTCAALAGVLTSSRTGSAQADIGIGLELSAITAVVVGGTSIFGGEGAIWRTVVGVILLQTIGNAFNLLGVNPTYKQVVQGVLILAAVSIDHLVRRRNR